MRAILGGITLPRHAKIVQKPISQYAKTRSPSGKLGVDVMSLGRSWVVSFPVITKTEFQQIYDLYKAQYAGSGSFTSFELTAEGANDQAIPATTVWIESSDFDLLWAGSHREGFTITLEEENAGN